MAGVDRSSEELDAVVRIRVNLDVVDGRSAADTAEGESVDLAGSGIDVAAVADGDVAHNPAVVRRDRTAVFDDVRASVHVEVSGGRRLEALNAVFADVGGAAVVCDRSVAENDKPAPTSGRGGARSLGHKAIPVLVDLGQRLKLVDRRHYDGRLCGSLRIDLRAADDHHRTEGIVVLGRGSLVIEGRIDLRPRLDRERRAVGDEHLVLEDVDVV